MKEEGEEETGRDGDEEGADAWDGDDSDDDGEGGDDEVRGMTMIDCISILSSWLLLPLLLLTVNLSSVFLSIHFSHRPNKEEYSIPLQRERGQLENATIRSRKSHVN